MSVPIEINYILVFFGILVLLVFLKVMLEKPNITNNYITEVVPKKITKKRTRRRR